MCGIVGYVGENASKELVNMLGKLEYRGYDSAGVAVVDGSSLIICKGVGYLQDVNKIKGLDKLDGDVGIGHVRWATHGEVNEANAHPFTDCGKRLAVVHNGVITNHESLKAKLTRHIFKSDTDSEVIAHMIERELERDGNIYASFERALYQLEGTYAIAVVIPLLEGKILTARRGSPLMVGKNGEVGAVASDVLAFGSSMACAVLPDGAIAEIGKGNYPDLDYHSVGHWQANELKTPHYMLQEIYEQPEAVKNVLGMDDKLFTDAALDVWRANDVVWTGCGTSRFAATIGRYVMAKVARKFTDVIVGSELHHFKASATDNTLIIAVSQSGETADVLEACKGMAKNGARVLSVINRPGSSLHTISNRVLPISCGPEIAVAATKSFINELALFYLLAYAMAGILQEGKQELSLLPEKISECIRLDGKVAELGTRLAEAVHIYYVAKGINYAVAGECALKLKEVSYIHTESMAAGELKHGTLALIEKGTPVIGICPNDNTYDEVLANLHEAKSRGAYIVGISDKNDKVFDVHLRLPKVDNLYYPFLCVVVGQLVAYYTAVAKGLNPDRPRNLAKSVTVL